MDDSILSLSDRGQLTIPKKVRNQITVKRFICHIQNGNIILEPLQTRNEFLQELDEAEKEWESKGGLNLNEIKAKYNL